MILRFFSIHPTTVIVIVTDSLGTTPHTFERSLSVKIVHKHKSHQEAPLPTICFHSPMPETLMRMQTNLSAPCGIRTFRQTVTRTIRSFPCLPFENSSTFSTHRSSAHAGLFYILFARHFQMIGQTLTIAAICQRPTHTSTTRTSSQNIY